MNRPALRAAFKSRRGLTPADSFFEWQERLLSGTNRKIRQPFRVMFKNGEPFCFACLWDKWVRPPSRDYAETDLDEALPSETVESFTIITPPAIAPLHDRMPAITASKDYDWWLNVEDPRGELNKLAKVFPESLPFKLWPTAAN